MTTSLGVPARLAGLFFSVLFMCTAVNAQEDKNAQGEPVKSQMLELWKPGDTGQRMRIRGRVTDTDGSPIPNVSIRFRHADSEGMNWSYYQGVLSTDERGVYQLGSVIPGNSHRLSHVHVYINHPGYRNVATEFYFKDDPKADATDPNAIFLEESNVDGEKMMYGRWDIALVPQ